MHENDAMLCELKEKQKELIKLESDIEPTLREILRKVYNNRVNFEEENQVKKREQVQTSLKDYNAVIELLVKGTDRSVHPLGPHHLWI